jgi:hypothetical protein
MRSPFVGVKLSFSFLTISTTVSMLGTLLVHAFPFSRTGLRMELPSVNAIHTMTIGGKSLYTLLFAQGVLVLE